jgi:hypothetical protein
MNIIMHLSTTDLYFNCDELIKEANLLYNIVKDKKLHQDDKHYINRMNKYINTYKNFKEINKTIYNRFKEFIDNQKSYFKILLYLDCSSFECAIVSPILSFLYLLDLFSFMHRSNSFLRKLRL